LKKNFFAGGFAGAALGQDSAVPGGGGCGPGIGKLKKGLDNSRVLCYNETVEKNRRPPL